MIHITQNNINNIEKNCYIIVQRDNTIIPIVEKCKILSFHIKKNSFETFNNPLKKTMTLELVHDYIAIVELEDKITLSVSPDFLYKTEKTANEYLKYILKKGE